MKNIKTFIVLICSVAVILVSCAKKEESTTTPAAAAAVVPLEVQEQQLGELLQVIQTLLVPFIYGYLGTENLLVGVLTMKQYFLILGFIQV